MRLRRLTMMSVAVALMLVTARIALGTPSLGARQALRAADEAFAAAIEAQQTNPNEAKGKFAEAAAAYGAIEREHGIVNAGVLYNIGNCELRGGRLGRAIAAYREALALRPGDDDIQANLRVARSRVADRIDLPGRSAVVRALTFWHQWPGERKVVVFLIGNLVGWMGLAARVWMRRLPIWPALVGVAVAGVMATSIGVSMWKPAPSSGVVIEAGVVGRQGPGGEGVYEASFTRPLSDGVEFRVVEDRGAWLLVELGDGRRTWLPSTQVAIVRALRD